MMKWKTENLILFAAVLVAVFAYAKPAGAIYGGGYTSFPQVGLIALAGATNVISTCSGTLIAPRLVLTAGHCFGSGRWPIVFFPPNNSIGYAVANFSVLGSTAGGQNDIAVVMLSSAVPAAPWAITSKYPSGQIILIGWGESCRGCGDIDQRARASSATFENYACHGDSGGPVLSFDPQLGGYVVAGVISVGAPWPCGGVGFDIFGYPQNFYNQLQRLIAQYGGAPLCTASVNPPSGDQSTQFVSALDAPGATSCSYNLDGRGGGCNLSSPPVFSGGMAGAGDHKLTFNVSNAQGTARCTTSFSVAVPPGSPGVSLSPQASSVNPGASVTFTANVSNQSSSVYYNWAYQTAAAPESPDADRFASLSFGKGTVANQLATLLEGLLRFPGLASLFPQPATSLLAPAQK